MISASNSEKAKPSLLAIIMPGFLVAATGVGAGDLATASFSGSQLGVAILWAVVVGGLLKFTLTEGLARWQLVTGQTLLEGVAQHLGNVVGFFFLPYLLLWSFFVGSALISASGITLHAIFPVFDNAFTGKWVFGIASSMSGLLLVLIGGFALFEKVMALSVGVMFAVVLVMAGLLWPGADVVLSGLFVPSIPYAQGTGVTWTLALIGGVGGTLTILCYGYWIREKGRIQEKDIGICRIDLAVGYSMTVLFGLSMVIIGSTIEIEGRGANLLIVLAEKLEEPLGVYGRWLFLVGAFSAIFSSLLGVWQAVPYLFADVWRLFVQKKGYMSSSIDNGDMSRSKPYRWFLVALAVIPIAGLFVSFKEVQKLYAVIGAMFIPMLAVVLLVLNGRRAWMGQFVNRPITIIVLLSTLIFFGVMAGLKWFG
ncbi:MAG: Nramp family divalent metal transporter [Pseudomonadales bacterium]|nr:Nramp family divalent metal transporter [Pseudomonadales bacterium]